MRAWVLSGGGPLAVAWEAGLLAGFAESGVRAVDTDFVLGTSAGAIVGAQIAAGVEAGDLAAVILAEAKGVPPPGAMRYPPAALARLPELFARAQSRPDDPAAARADVGAAALAAEAGTETEEQSVARFAMSLRASDWPSRPFGCVAVDAVDGSVHILTRDCGVPLARAVAASCSLPGLNPPITIGARRYIDGGFASTANADLVAGHARALVIAFRPPGPGGDRIAARLDRQIAALRAGGTDVMTILPDAGSSTAIGEQAMDVRRRPDIAHTGMAQGKAVAEQVRAWLEPGAHTG